MKHGLGRLSPTRPNAYTSPKILSRSEKYHGDTMPSLAFDTHAAVKRLQDAGADERLAEAVVATLGAAVSEHVATKTDIATVQADITTVKTDLEARIERLDAKIEKLELRMTNKLYAAVVVGVGLIKALDFLIG